MKLNQQQQLMDSHLELFRSFQAAEVWTGGDSLLQRLEENSLEVQHLRQTAEQRLHLGGGHTVRHNLTPNHTDVRFELIGSHLVFTEERFLLQRRQIDVKQAHQILTETRKLSFTFSNGVKHVELHRSGGAEFVPPAGR